MSEEKDPAFYEQKLAIGNLSVEEVEDYLAQVEKILLGLEKGLKILKKIDREPEAKVLENQEKFLQIRKKLLALV